jgi:hypothetical protein
MTPSDFCTTPMRAKLQHERPHQLTNFAPNRAVSKLRRNVAKVRGPRDANARIPRAVRNVQLPTGRLLHFWNAVPAPSKNRTPQVSQRLELMK